METDRPPDNFAELKQFTEKYSPLIQNALRENLPISPPKIENDFNRLIEANLFSDQQRIKPLLTLLGAELFGGNPQDVLPAAAAVEYISASSRLFKKLQFIGEVSFEEGVELNDVSGRIMLFVALGFLNATYPLVFVNHIGMPDRAMQAHAEIVECVGASGLIGDLASLQHSFETKLTVEIAEPANIQAIGTPALIRLALRLGAILAGADYLDLANLSRVAEVIGAAHQFSVSLNGNEGVRSDALAQESKLNILVDEAKRLLVENFPSNEARSCLIQLVESLTMGSNDSDSFTDQ